MPPRSRGVEFVEEHWVFFSEQQEASLLQHSEQSLLQFAVGQHGALAGQHWLQVLEQSSARLGVVRPRSNRVKSERAGMNFMNAIYLEVILGQRRTGSRARWTWPGRVPARHLPGGGLRHRERRADSKWPGFSGPTELLFRHSGRPPQTGCCRCGPWPG